MCRCFKDHLSEFNNIISGFKVHLCVSWSSNVTQWYLEQNVLLFVKRSFINGVYKTQSIESEKTLKNILKEVTRPFQWNKSMKILDQLPHMIEESRKC